MKLGYGFGQDDIFKKPSNEMDKTPLKIAMNNQPGETISLGASPAFGQAQNNTKGSMNQIADIMKSIPSNPGLEVDVKQNELNAGTDDPFTAIEQSGGITQSTVSSTQPGSPQGGSGVANFSNDESTSGDAWSNPLGFDEGLSDNVSLNTALTNTGTTTPQEGSTFTGTTNLQAANTVSGITSPLEQAVQNQQPVAPAMPTPGLPGMGEANITADAAELNVPTVPTNQGLPPAPISPGMPADPTDPTADNTGGVPEMATQPTVETALPTQPPAPPPPPPPAGDPIAEANFTVDETDPPPVITDPNKDDPSKKIPTDDKKGGIVTQEVAQDWEQRFRQNDATRGTDLTNILSNLGYDAGELRKRFGDMFEDYDPTRERFTERGLGLDFDQLGLARGQAQTSYDRATGQAERQFGLLEDRQGYTDRARDISLGRADLQRGLLESEKVRSTQDLLRQRERFDIQEEGLTDTALQRQRGLDLQQSGARSGARASLFDAYASGANTGGFAGGGARMSAAQRATQRTAELYQREADRTGIAREGLNSLLQRQLSNLSLNRDQSVSSYQRKQDQLGAQLGGLDLTDASTKLQHEQTSGAIGSQLKGLEAELGQVDPATGQRTGGFLQQSYKDQLAGLDLGFERRELGADVDLFGQREDYREKIGDRLIDLIQSEADLGGTKTGEKVFDKGATRMGDDGTLDYFNGTEWVKLNDYLSGADQ